MSRPVRLVLFAAALCALATGLLAGLARLGFNLPAATLAGQHGPLMICGVFGTLISLERAVAMGQRWPYLAPGLAALGVIGVLAGLSPEWAALPFIAAAAVLSIASVKLWYGQKVMHLATLALASLLWLLGNLLWWRAGFALPAVPAWLAFLVLTIAGERLELSRFLPTPPSAHRLFAAWALLLTAGALWPQPLLFALALIGLVVWLLRHDIVRRTLRQDGLPRFIAVCLASGYVWLLVSAVLMLLGEFAPQLQWRDASLHALLLGFVFSMVFGHAPIVLPAVARLRLPYHPVLYLPLLVLQSSLALRLLASGLDDFALRQQAGLANAAALLLFALTVLGLLLSARKN
ncbi:MAG TPA: hypothetical protein VNZ68_04740 [Rhodocyclaceae bacterium]|nr:hypothetical protein [Rhodocyclaceae bacterium]